MAGAGFKTFVDGNVLTASEVNTYLMQQAVMVFADASARSTAIAAPSEGMVTYLTGSDVLEYYDGAAWQPILDQDVISAKGDLIVGTADDTVQALTVGSNEHRLVADSGETTGLKYVADTTNYAIGAKGDLLVGTAADTLVNLGVGSDGQVLTADSGETSGVKWAAAAAGGGKVLQVVQDTKTDTFTTSSSSFTDITGLSLSITPSAATSKILVIANINMSSDGLNVRRTPVRLMRDSTAVFIGDSASNRTRVGSTSNNHDDDAMSNVSIMYLDSPTTTSATTYKVQTIGLSLTNIYVNRSVGDTDNASFERGASSIIAIEIGA